MTSIPPEFVTSFGGERFELLSCIGRGATGGVHRARSSQDASFGFSREVCVKRLAGQLSPDAERAMREEARLLASVRHANVVSLLGMGHETNGAPFLVIELIDGADLRTLAAATTGTGGLSVPGALPIAVAVHVACALLRALGAVQRAIPGLVHRDVTPHNVLISREGEVKLTDFGIALALDRARWTRPSVVKGKYGYMAPEQIRGETLDVRTDLFAVGVILFELLTRRRPWFAAHGSMDELRAIERGEIASIVECRPHLDRALADAVDRMLALDKRDRFGSCDAAMRALGPFGSGELGSLRLASILESAIPSGRRSETDGSEAESGGDRPNPNRPNPNRPNPDRPNPNRPNPNRSGDTLSSPRVDPAPSSDDGDHVAYGPALDGGADLSGIEGTF